MKMRLLTIKEVSETLSVKEKTVYSWVELRRIPFVKLNGSIRFDQDDISEWIKNCKSVSDYS
jgi:excisionase family DNA binding protein